MNNVCNSYSYSTVTTVSTATDTMRDTHVTLVNDDTDTFTRYTWVQKKPTLWTGLKIPSLVRVSRNTSGFDKDTSLRRVVAHNQLRCLRQSQDYPVRQTRAAHQTEAQVSHTEDFLDWFDRAWDKAEIWKFDDTWREFDDSWGRYTEQRLLLRVR